LENEKCKLQNDGESGNRECFALRDCGAKGKSDWSDKLMKTCEKIVAELADKQKSLENTALATSKLVRQLADKRSVSTTLRQLHDEI
jgi:hypothetical protein